MSLDIIHPSDRFGDAAFVQPWSKRASTTSQAPARSRIGRLSDPDFCARFKRAYLGGVKFCVMVEEFGAARSQLDQYREALDLPRRQARRAKPVKRLTVRLTDDEIRSITAARTGRHRSAAAFIRAAILEKLAGRS